MILLPNTCFLGSDELTWRSSAVGNEPIRAFAKPTPSTVKDDKLNRC